MTGKKITKVGLVGGPGGGKSSILPYLQQKLVDYGYNVVIVPEVATDFILAGIEPTKMESYDFQRGILEHTIEREDKFVSMANCMVGDTVVLCDRGAMDAAAYMSPANFERLLGEKRMTPVDIGDRRYDGVIFLRSPAVDKPEVYTTINNKARRETVEQAKALDERTLAAWTGHPHMRVVDNSTDFPGKQVQALQHACRLLGIPEPLEIEFKYRVSDFNPGKLPRPYREVQIVQYYLKNDDTTIVERVRSRSHGGGCMFYHTMKREIRPGVRSEFERPITADEYYAQLARVDPECGKIEKTRYCFPLGNQYFELDVFRNPAELILLEAEVTNENDKVTIPDFLAGKTEDVTLDPEYSNIAIARRIAKAT